MKASELRIGNFVQHKCGAHYKISAYDIVDVADGTFNIEPIPLTGEWLSRFGFERSENQNNTPSWTWKKNNEVWFYETWKDRDIYVNSFLRRNQKQINHVHQLQNLYFALTGEELTIKE